MASVPPGPNMAPANISLPPNLTQQHVQEVYQVCFLISFLNAARPPDHLPGSLPPRHVSDFAAEIPADARAGRPQR